MEVYRLNIVRSKKMAATKGFHLVVVSISFDSIRLLKAKKAASGTAFFQR